jgi:ParB/RepB/Spo0J family partition protein
MSRDINLALIDPDPRQPRQHYDEGALQELATSMQGNGLMQAITLRPVGDRYVIVGGHRRVRAAQALGWKTIRAEVQDISPDDAMWLALVENLQRENLTPTEEAHGYEALLACGVTQQALGQRIGKSQSHIATMLRYLRLPETLQFALDGKLITEGHAKQLLRVPDAEEQERLYQLICEHDWTVKVLTGEVAQAIRRVEAKRALSFYPESFQPDDELLAAVGCEMNWSNVWMAESFRYCASRLEGVIARLLYIASAYDIDRRQVYVDGWTP